MMTAEEFCRFIWRKYLVERRYDIFEEILDERLSVIGTGAHEMSRNRDEFTTSISREMAEWDGSFQIKSEWYQTTDLAEDLFLVIGELTAKEDAKDGILFDMYFRFSAILERREGGWKAIHVHQSVPDPNQASDEFFPHRMVEKNAQQVLYNLRHDSLTGLLNRLYLKETVDRSMEDQPDGSMLMLDIDKFKHLNDTHGHPFGDSVLRLLAQSLRTSFPGSIIGRIGGDEFIVYVPKNDLDKFLENFHEDWLDSQRPLCLPEPVTVSIGISRCPLDGRTYEDVWVAADKALYIAKRDTGRHIHYLHG